MPGSQSFPDDDALEEDQRQYGRDPASKQELDEK
jgi:hypothetical protein